MKRYLLIAAGFLSLATGIVGIFVPLLPTTVFLLLAAACFFRSSPRLYQWIINHRVFGSYIRIYREYHAITRVTKLVALASLWLLMAFSIIFVAGTWWLRLILVLVAIGVTIHIALIRVLSKDQIKEIQEYEAQKRTMVADTVTGSKSAR